MSVLVNTAFWQRLQGDNIDMCELVDLELPNGASFHWTTANQPLTYTLSGDLTVYQPFPGAGATGFEDGIDLSVAVIDFVMANTGSVLQGQLLSQDFALGKLNIGEVFTDTPDLGRMPVYNGKIGDFSYNRHELTGQARNLWKSLNIQWPYYTYNDNCGWRFGSKGCGFNTASVTINVTSVVVGSSDVTKLLLPSGTLSNSFADGRFNFGRATITSGTNSGSVRPIMAHTGDLLTLAYPLSNTDLTGIKVSIYPGCNKRIIDDCKSLYNNTKNFFGFWTMPKEGDAY